MNMLPESLIPTNDAGRVRSLHHYQILNTTPEPIFDEYVALAAQMFNLPISLISLVDEHEVFFKANEGLPGLEPVPRPDSLCSAAILQSKVLTFTDLNTEACSLVNPYVAQSAGLRFYAGAALHMPDGSNIGSLCVIGREPRPIEPQEEEMLSMLAELVSLTIELRYAYLSRDRAYEWQAAQRELEEILHDHTALARYLTTRAITPAATARDLNTVARRLAELREIITGHLAELAETPAQ
ncbi:GAF domain-containing protein [Hymenobacter daecheongensis DSM 21074]|uniref:GAF domain-containing protein n=2 Tax=Hymenobacter daecheongensis TaxID=496053 RepID=A0A1M6E8Y3_9BACT|nr:GAF domain-containing protein [Hymenobacter daecheongensis DSM 21074]